MSMWANYRLRHRFVSHGQQDEVWPQLSIWRSHPATASPPHQTSYEAQPGKRHVTVPKKSPRHPALPEAAAFSMFAGALQRLDLLEMEATIGRRSKPALLSFGETRGRAVPYPTAITQMLPGPAIRRAPTTATTNFS